MSCNPKVLFLREEYDDDLGDGYRRSQELFEEEDGKERTIYWVNNLSDCPEDAIIDRSLFSVEEYVRAMEYGIRLAHQGYDGIKLVEVS